MLDDKLETKKAVTLIEILLVVMLSALLMTAIIPFIRSVSETWNVGSSKTEILQNGRAAQETMTRYIRQARRITGIPGSSGNYIKIRDRDDTYNIIFYHNVMGSPYYIGETGIIKVNDLVMRSDPSGTYENSLVAPSFQNLSFNFLGDDGMPVTAANQVKSVQIQMVLSDPSGSTTHTLALEDTIILRQDVKITTPVWFSHSTQVGELSSDLWVDGFSSPNSVSVNQATNECWVADTGNSRIKKLSATGTTLVNAGGSNQPRSVSVNAATGECWIADTNNNRIKKLSPTGSLSVNKTGFNQPRSVSVNAATGECWVADTNNNRIKKLSADGKKILVDVSGFNQPQSVSVNWSTGDGSCLVADTFNDRIVKLSSAGSISWTSAAGIFSDPQSVSVNPSDGSCWVADTGNGRVVKLSSAGIILWSAVGFSSPQSVSVDSNGGCWVVDSPVGTENDKIIKLNPQGDREFEISGFNNPLSVSAG